MFASYGDASTILASPPQQGGSDIVADDEDDSSSVSLECVCQIGSKPSSSSLNILIAHL